MTTPNNGASQMDEQSRELLACPWCAERPRYSPKVRTLGEAVECENEKCLVQPSTHSMREGDAIRLWNTRTPASPTSDDVALAEVTWREGWKTCRDSLTDAEAFCLTADVEEDAWRDSRASKVALAAQPKGDG